VVFLNGYQLGCADAVLQAGNPVSVYCDNCSVPKVPPIETLGAAFGQFLASLRYTNGTPVPMVDVVAHSMGGLIVRRRLSFHRRRRESARRYSLPRRTSEHIPLRFPATTQEMAVCFWEPRL
jgi:hypothetical protein